MRMFSLLVSFIKAHVKCHLVLYWEGKVVGYTSLLRLECRQANSSNQFQICIFFFISYSFGIEMINTFIHSRSYSGNHSLFQTKMSKVYTRSQTKTALNLTQWGSTYLYHLYKGVPHTGLRSPCCS